MVRLQRVTFTALHQYLGLSTELVQNVRINDDQILKIHKNLVVSSIQF